MKRLLFGFASIVAISTVAAPAALAQQQTPPPATDLTASAGDQAGDVVVTARKRNERLRDVPMAASVIGAGDISQRGGLDSTKDLVTNIPSVAFGDTSTPLTSEISIRGSGTSRGTSADSGVGLYKDGAYVGGGAQGGRTFGRFDLFDASQIEVLRGTQGALYGRDAVGGAINILVARPTQKLSGSVTEKDGRQGFTEFEAVGNVPLTDHLALRVSGDFMSQYGGFYYNPDFKTYIDSQGSSALRAQLRYETGNFDANLMVEHAADKYPALNLQLWIQPNVSEPQGVFIEPMFSRPHNTKDLDKDQINDVEFTSTYHFTFGTLNWISLWRDRRDIQQFDNDLLDATLYAQIQAAGLLAPGVTLDPNGGRDNQGHTATFNQEVYLSGDYGTQFKWLVGAEYLKQHDADTIVILRTPTKANPSVGSAAPTTQSLESYAAYGSLEFDLTSKISFTGQLRYTKDSKGFYANQYDDGTGLVTAGKLVTGAFDPSNTSYDLTAAYKFLPGWLGYAKVGTGFRAGGFNSSLGDPRQPIPVPVSYGNENTTSYEIGVKGNLTKALYITAAGYYTDVDNLIVQTDNGCKATNPVCPVAQTNFATDGGQAHISGLETEATLNLNIFGGPLVGTIGGSMQGGKITQGVFNGDIPPQLPRYLASANLNYSHSLPWMLTGFVNAVYSARWGGVQEIAQTPELHDYQLVNGRFGVRKGPIEASFYINNAFDTYYLEFEATTARRFNQPRTYGLQLSYTW